MFELQYRNKHSIVPKFDVYVFRVSHSNSLERALYTIGIGLKGQSGGHHAAGYCPRIRMPCTNRKCYRCTKMVVLLLDNSIVVFNPRYMYSTCRSSSS